MREQKNKPFSVEDLDSSINLGTCICNLYKSSIAFRARSIDAPCLQLCSDTCVRIMIQAISGRPIANEHACDSYSQLRHFLRGPTLPLNSFFL